MDIKITPGHLRGSVTVPQSKSHCHRLLIAAHLAGRRDQVMKNINEKSTSDDIIATEGALAALESSSEPDIFCNESGSTLRFMLPVAMALKSRARFFGRGRLPDRPLSPLWEQMEEHGCTLQRGTGELICTGKGPMKGGDFFIPGNVSSQYVTGLLYALPLTKDGGIIHMTSPLESKGYVEMTLDVLRDFGITVERKEDMYIVPGSQHYAASDPDFLIPEGDWSAAAFWYTAKALGEDIECSGTKLPSSQGDSRIREICGKYPDGLDNIDAKNIPDLVPILAVLMALTPGTHRISGAARLREKESDRLKTTASGLNALGADVRELPDGLVITGKDRLSGGTADGAGDHRIVMAMAIAACRCSGPVTILGAEAVSKSYPGFFSDYRKLGGIADEINVR